MSTLTTDQVRVDELYESIREELAPSILKLFTPEIGNPGVNILDASLLQFLPWTQQPKVWDMAKDVNVPVLRFRLIHKIILFAGINISLREDPSSYPDTLRLPDKAELAQMIEDLAK